MATSVFPLPVARGLDHQHVLGPVRQRLDGAALIVARLEIPHVVEQRVDHLRGRPSVTRVAPALGGHRVRARAWGGLSNRPPSSRAQKRNAR